MPDLMLHGNERRREKGVSLNKKGKARYLPIQNKRPQRRFDMEIRRSIQDLPHTCSINGPHLNRGLILQNGRKSVKG